MSEPRRSAERVEDSEGRQYHIGLARGEVATDILTCGDPARAERIAGMMDPGSIRIERRNREYVTFTGARKGRPLTVMATGMGCDNTEIAVVELSRIVDDPTFIRVGTCGSLQPEIELEDLVISTGSVRLENTSTWFVPEGFPALAHFEVVAALREAARASGRRHHVGLTATAPGFYGAQGRHVEGFPPRDPDIVAKLAAVNVKNLEMETSTLFTLCAMRDFRVGAVCAVLAKRSENVFVGEDRKDPAELGAIETALAAFELLAGR